MTNEQSDLVLAYIPFANKIAYHFLKKVPKCVQLDELISAAYMGLVKAVIKYNNINSFEFYAFRRIKGEIQDYLRSLSWGSRANRIKIQSEVDMGSRATESFSEMVDGLSDVEEKIIRLYYQDNHTIKEIADKLGYSNTRIHQILKDSIEFLRAA